jgi:hypothetical protein
VQCDVLEAAPAAENVESEVTPATEKPEPTEQVHADAQSAGLVIPHRPTGQRHD